MISFYPINRRKFGFYLVSSVQLRQNMTALLKSRLLDKMEETAWVLRNAAGASCGIIGYGAIVTHLKMPDRRGRFADVVLGFPSPEQYLNNPGYLGAMVGRVAGRVPGGQIRVDGLTHQLPLNDGSNHLHGGSGGLDQKIWSGSRIAAGEGGEAVRLTCRSSDGDQGYPGTADFVVTYTLTATNDLIVETEATVDQATPINLTHHSYFNLAGEGDATTILDHEIQIFSSEYVPCGDGMTPLGVRHSVLDESGRSNDLRQSRRIGDVVPQLDQQHGALYLLKKDFDAPSMVVAARVIHPGSGRVLTVKTTEECLQFYTGSALERTLAGKNGAGYDRYAGLCLECQGYSGATTAEGFRSILARPDQPRRQTTVYSFSTT